ncbi:uncharacterized protein HMPREF1541_01413 [Cyphellophora europaea CBS 101466]|uniref:Tyrosyl-DNA phosphodiesterase n=1 Tax=Cyphellophora europaea (strain CBS 101466) TaxID=1220924 RepID=W2SEV2_CYPE1|nr:uncharacterized protein HMPREF1541_01413 [Cyphellophora europaea CBS 101466]ETN47222.1 hypothetical protein HMPREF1541_01413 [Cyphellophora europaea CBS 101466]
MESPNKRRRLADGRSTEASIGRQQRAAFLSSISRDISPPPSSRAPDSSTKASTSLTTPSSVIDANESMSKMQGAERKRTNEGANGTPHLVDSPFKLTTIRDLPASSNIDAVSLHDILGNPLIKEAWVFNFCFDIDWMMQCFDPDVRSMVQVKVIHGSWKREDPNKIAIDDACERWSNVDAASAYLPDPFGTHHSKMFILFTHDKQAEVIIHTANMLPKDWANMTQAVWRSGPLLKSDNKTQDLGEIGTGARFKYDLLQYLKAYKRLTKSVVEQLQNFDFSSVRGALVASVPCKIDNTQSKSTAMQHLWGYPQLREVISQTQQERSTARPQPSQPHLIAQVSSIATLHSDWLTTLVEAFSWAGGKPKKLPTLDIIYPTAINVAASLDGYAAGGSIHTKAESPAHLKQIEKLRPHLAQWTSEPSTTFRALRDTAAPHIKTYIQFNAKPTVDSLSKDEVAIEWALVTSANLSTQAWGSLPRKEDKSKSKSNSTKSDRVKEGMVHIQSFEIGVVVWPELFCEDSSDLSVRMVPVFGKDSPHQATDNGTNTSEIVVGIRMPYDLPTTSYKAGELPWSPHGTYKEPDSKGKTWN